MRVNNKKIKADEVVWDAFRLSGKPGYYLLYKALSNKDRERPL
jgi:hypothetical protein